MKISRAIIIIGLLAVISLAQAPSDKVQKMAELIVSSYNAKDYNPIVEQFNGEMKAALSAEKLKDLLDDSHKQIGPILKLGTPKFLLPSVAVFPVDFATIKLELTVALDPEGKIAGFSMSPPKAEKPKNTGRNKTVLGLPLKGEWFIFWGGDAVTQNYHQDAPTQRFAFDILKMDADGKSHKGDGSKNEDYYAFGQEIVADADGVVTDVVTGVRDNVPGVMNPVMALGNFVMIRHANGEISVFCHLKFDSTRVKAGQQVKRGETIGLCGNTGNSTEPHLHYQVQNTTLFEDENSMKVFFEKIVVKRDGKTETKTEYSPVKGDIVSQN